MKNTEKKTDVKKTAKVKTAKGEALEADGVKENIPMLIVKHEEDIGALQIIESGILRDIKISGQLDQAKAMFSIKIGIALRSAKDMLRHKEYGPWLEAKFGEQFSSRNAQYCSKLAGVFANEMQGKLALPAPKEAGNWLAVQNEGGDFFNNVKDFVGDLSFTDLLEKHKIKIAKAKGGWKPSEILVNRFVMDRPELVGVPFDSWADEQKDDFRAWADKHNDGDSAEAKTMAAAGAWNSIRLSLETHGMERASWKFLTIAELRDVADVMKDVLADINKALKAADKSA